MGTPPPRPPRATALRRTHQTLPHSARPRCPGSGRGKSAAEGPAWPGAFTTVSRVRSTRVSPGRPEVLGAGGGG